MTTKDEALRAAGRALAVTRVERDALSPRRAAVAAWYPGHELSVDEIEALIISQRKQALAALEVAQSRPLAA